MAKNYDRLKISTNSNDFALIRIVKEILEFLELFSETIFDKFKWIGFYLPKC